MKIIHFIPTLGNGGAERLVIDLCNELSKDNKLILCTLRDIDESMFFVNDLNPDVEIISFGKKKGLSINLPFIILRYLSRVKPDIVNTHLPSLLPYILLSVLCLRNVLFFHTVHNVPLNEEPRRFMRIIRTILIRKSKLFPIAISDKIGTQFNELYKVSPVRIIYNGRSALTKGFSYSEVEKEINLLKPNISTKVFITIGRLDAQKNHGLLINVFRRLYKQNVNAILLIIGEDNENMFKDFYDKSKSLNTHWLGLKKNIGDYLMLSDCFCLSSVYEGFPITIIEAMSIGLPIISTSVGGIPDVVKEGVNGFICLGNEEDYYDSVMRFLNSDDSNIQTIKLNNKLIYNDKYSIEVTARNYLSAYSSIKKKQRNSLHLGHN
jgi:glycosyltransferase involved in cell wall biosynthesis